MRSTSDTFHPMVLHKKAPRHCANSDEAFHTQGAWNDPLGQPYITISPEILQGGFLWQRYKKEAKVTGSEHLRVMIPQVSR